MVSAPTMMRTLAEIAQWVKLSGTPDELQSLELLRGRLNDYGYQTKIVMHDAYISLPGASRVEVDGHVLVSITHSMAASTPPGGLRGRLIYVGEGTAADFAKVDVRGALVLAEGLATPGVTDRASRAGAVGQIHISPYEHLHEMCVSPVWGNPSPSTAAELPKTAVVTLSDRDGGLLRHRVQRGEQPEVVLHAEVDTGWRPTPILIADMDAPCGKDAPFLLLSGHHDTWYFGVMDNGAANVTMLEVARLCAERRSEWRRGIRICFWSGHSHGRYSSSAWYADHHWFELERRCIAHVNVNSTGGVGATAFGIAGAATELGALAAEALRDQAGVTWPGNRLARNCDQSFWGVGVPGIFSTLSQQPPGASNIRNNLGWWWHTPDDLLDKIDPNFLVRDTRIYMHVMWRLLSDEALPFDYGAYAEELLQELGQLQRRLNGRLCLNAVIEAAEALCRATKSLDALPAARRNEAQMKLSRVLVPLAYTNGDRFVHDAALPQTPWPALDPIRRLADVSPVGPAIHVFETASVRARNHVRQAVLVACDTLSRFE